MCVCVEVRLANDSKESRKGGEERVQEIDGFGDEVREGVARFACTFILSDFDTLIR